MAAGDVDVRDGSDETQDHSGHDERTFGTDRRDERRGQQASGEETHAEECLHDAEHGHAVLVPNTALDQSEPGDVEHKVAHADCAATRF